MFDSSIVGPVLKSTHNLCFEQKYKMQLNFQLKFVSLQSLESQNIASLDILLPVYTMFPAATAATFQATVDETG